MSKFKFGSPPDAVSHELCLSYYNHVNAHASTNIASKEDMEKRNLTCGICQVSFLHV